MKENLGEMLLETVFKTIMNPYALIFFLILLFVNFCFYLMPDLLAPAVMYFSYESNEIILYRLFLLELFLHFISVLICFYFLIKKEIYKNVD